MEDVIYDILSHNLGATHVVHMIEQYGFDLEKFDIERNKDLLKL